MYVISKNQKFLREIRFIDRFSCTWAWFLLNQLNRNMCVVGWCSCGWSVLGSRKYVFFKPRFSRLFPFFLKSTTDLKNEGLHILFRTSSFWARVCSRISHMVILIKTKNLNSHASIIYSALQNGDIDSSSIMYLAKSTVGMKLCNIWHCWRGVWGGCISSQLRLLHLEMANLNGWGGFFSDIRLSDHIRSHFPHFKTWATQRISKDKTKFRERTPFLEIGWDITYMLPVPCRDIGYFSHLLRLLLLSLEVFHLIINVNHWYQQPGLLSKISHIKAKS